MYVSEYNELKKLCYFKTRFKCQNKARWGEDNSFILFSQLKQTIKFLITEMGLRCKMQPHDSERSIIYIHKQIKH